MEDFKESGSSTSESDALINAALPDLFHIQIQRPLSENSYSPIADATGFIVIAPSGNKELITVRHIVEAKGPNDNIDVYNTEGFDRYKVRLHDKQPPNWIDVRIFDFIGNSPSGKGLIIGFPPKRNDFTLGLGYSSQHDAEPDAYIGHLVDPITCNNMENPDGTKAKLFTVTPPADPGASGSPVLNASGEVVGVLVGKGENTHNRLVTAVAPLADILPYLEGASSDKPKPLTCR